MINKFLIYIIIFLHFSFFANASTEIPFPNMFVTKTPITYKEELEFKGFEGDLVNLSNYNNEIYLLNFWASWCAPCKKEMPSLDKLQSNFNEIKIFPINIKESDKKKSEIFFKNLNINNLQIYFDIDSNLANIFWLRGIPTTIILNKNKNSVILVDFLETYNDGIVQDLAKLVQEFYLGWSSRYLNDVHKLRSNIVYKKILGGIVLELKRK